MVILNFITNVCQESFTVAKFRSGVYRPSNPAKFINTKGIKYRSKWECHFLAICDDSRAVTSIGYEVIKVPYTCPHSLLNRLYVIDYVAVIDGQTYAIEIKPVSQCKAPINIAKWRSAEKWCEARGIIFIVITELDLFQ